MQTTGLQPLVCQYFILLNGVLMQKEKICVKLVWKKNLDNFPLFYWRVVASPLNHSQSLEEE